MTPGEPLEETQDGAETTDALLLGPVMDTPNQGRRVLRPVEVDLLSQTLEQTMRDGDDADTDQDDDDDEDTAFLDEEVRNLLSAIAEEEDQHDEAWVEASRDEDDAEDGDAAFAALERETLAGQAEEATETRDAEPAPEPADLGPVEAEIDDAPAESAAPAEEEAATLAPVDEPVAQADASPDTNTSIDNIDALRAIDMLGNRFEAAEARNEQALDRIGHALGMIATRIDGLESRATDRTIADVAFVAAPPDEDDEEDASVAPYIARAEKELKARKGSGSMDIFDRIARAAETEFDDQTGSSETRVLANASDGRRVGTKKWQPSKAVKKRMEQLELARANSAGTGAETDERPRPAASGPHVPEDAAPSPRAAARADEALDLETGPEPVIAPEDDDAGLSVLPGARGRRRNRARKSALDSDFENVFAEEGDKPSIQSLRRKMREQPVEAPEEEKSRGGMLGGMLGKKSAKKDAPEPVIDEESDEDEMPAAFDAPLTAPSPAPAKSRKKARPADLDIDDEEDDEDWDDEDTAADNRRKPLIYALIALAAGAGFMVWKTFLA